MEHLLETKDLSISFLLRGQWLQAVTGVSFHVNKGETFGIVGESGCGKSVTNMAMLHLLPPTTSRIDSGQVVYKGQDITEYDNREMSKVRGKEISMIFQDSMTSLNPSMTIGAQLMEAARLHGKMPRAEARLSALGLLDKVGLSSPMKRFKEYPHQLSGGMRQRVMIAMALIQEPSLLIADEPTTALDVTIQAQILRLMKDLRSDNELSIILITHDMGVVAQMADRIMVMYAGNVMETAAARDLFHDPLHPYSQGLLRSIPRSDKTTEELRSIPGTVPSLREMPSGCRFCTRCPFCSSRCEKAAPPLFSKGNHEVRCWLYENEEVRRGSFA